MSVSKLTPLHMQEGPHGRKAGLPPVANRSLHFRSTCLSLWRTGHRLFRQWNPNIRDGLVNSSHVSTFDHIIMEREAYTSAQSVSSRTQLAQT